MASCPARGASELIAQSLDLFPQLGDLVLEGLQPPAEFSGRLARRGEVAGIVRFNAAQWRDAFVVARALRSGSPRLHLEVRSPAGPVSIQPLTFIRSPRVMNPVATASCDEDAARESPSIDKEPAPSSSPYQRSECRSRPGRPDPRSIKFIEIVKYTSSESGLAEAGRSSGPNESADGEGQFSVFGVSARAMQVIVTAFVPVCRLPAGFHPAGDADAVSPHGNSRKAISEMWWPVHHGPVVQDRSVHFSHRGRRQTLNAALDRPRPWPEEARAPTAESYNQ